MSKKSIFIVLLFAQTTLFASFTWVELSVIGLTCSQCSRNVEMKIRKLDFVDSITMDLSNTKSKIYINKNTTADLSKIAKAVLDAGFSVGYMYASYYFDTLTLQKNQTITIDGKLYTYLGNATIDVKGETVIKIIGELYLSKSEYRKWRNEVKQVDSKGGYCFTI